ncbi:MAG: hypothetical protein CVV27_08990 [Candidatus Melainabacteria bacterium HGW-Melainabacteria-1]|nr:MAG: hypothetical protein CVV27_08990 [Candidatus Melainabacteria bacterium HGW-Melainabacteria-1]
MPKYGLKSGCVLSLLLLISCVDPGAGKVTQALPQPSSPPIGDHETLLSNRRLTFTWKHQDLNLTPVSHPEIETLPRLTYLSNGDTLAVNKHKQKLTPSASQISHILSFVRLDAQGYIHWNKVYILNRLFNLGNVIQSGNRVYVVGTYYPELKTEPDYRNPIPPKSPISIGLLEFNESGELLSKRDFPLRKGSDGNVYQSSRVFALDDNQFAVSAREEVIFLSDENHQHLALELKAQTLHKTTRGEYLGAVLNRDHLELVKLNKDFEPTWKKSIGESFRGINAMSDLHSAHERYFLAYSINDLTNQNSYGQISLFFDDQGSVQMTSAHNALTEGALTIFAEIHGSYQDENSIYISATHTTGGLGQQKGAVITSKYKIDGSQVSVTAIPGFDNGKLNLSSTSWTMADLNGIGTRLSDQYSFQLLQGQTNLIPKGTRLQQNNNYLDSLIKDMSLPELQPLKISSQTAETLDLQLLTTKFEIQSEMQLE